MGVGRTCAGWQGAGDGKAQRCSSVRAPAGDLRDGCRRQPKHSLAARAAHRPPPCHSCKHQRFAARTSKTPGALLCPSCRGVLPAACPVATCVLGGGLSTLRWHVQVTCRRTTRPPAGQQVSADEGSNAGQGDGTVKRWRGACHRRAVGAAQPASARAAYRDGPVQAGVLLKGTHHRSTPACVSAGEEGSSRSSWRGLPAGRRQAGGGYLPNAVLALPSTCECPAGSTRDLQQRCKLPAWLEWMVPGSYCSKRWF